MSELQKTLNKIKRFDCNPGVYQVQIHCSNHMSGFEAMAVFRSNTAGHRAKTLSAHGDSPEEAVEDLLAAITHGFSKCSRCGEYPTQEKNNE